MKTFGPLSALFRARVAAGALAVAIAGAIAAPLSAAPLVGAPHTSETPDVADAVARGEHLFFEHSFGATASSVPLKVFEAVQDTDARFKPAGLASRYGLLFRDGRPLPIGFVSASALGVDRLSFNCSLCHTARVNGALWPGMPNRDLQMQRFEEDLMGSLAREDLSADRMLGQIQRRHPDLSPYEALQIRVWLALAHRQATQYKPSPNRAGPGRYDLLLTFKKRLGLPAHAFNANMDIPALFGVRMLKRYPRDGALGGNQDLVRYLIVRISGDNSPLVNGHVPTWVTDLNAYLGTLEPPKYPFAIDARKAERGHDIFVNTCAGCHGRYEPGAMSYPNLIIPIDMVGTDRNRIDVWDPASIAFVRKDPIMKRLDLQPGVGMMPASLRGVWATSPYLHNGSVPTLHAVLGDPAVRPTTFYRGGDAFDSVNVGLPTITKPSGPGQFLYDTRIAGNHNTGHPFGMPLSEDERMAVIEYLKTL